MTRPLAGLPQAARAKLFRRGAHRNTEPEQFLARLLPLCATFGVTRLADLTGLDRLRAPVFAACRPNSRSLALFQGKGSTVAAAKVSALMEAFETCCAEQFAPPLRLASAREMADIGAIVDVEALPRLGAEPFDSERRILWAEARDIVSGDFAHVPFEIAHANYCGEAIGESGALAATTNGLASGADFLEAVAHGLYETIERDAVALWSLGGDAARARTRLDPDSVEGDDARALIAACRACGITVGLWDITTDIGLPAFHCLLVDAAGGVDPEVGSGCHVSRDVALMRALSEAAQARATWISGARDDFEPGDYGDDARRRRAAIAAQWLTGEPRATFDSAPTFESESIREDVEFAAAAMARAGLEQILALDLSPPDASFAVARVIAPGLEGVYGEAHYRPGRRARARHPELA